MPILEEMQSKRANGILSGELSVKHEFVDRLLRLLNGDAKDTVGDSKSESFEGDSCELTNREVDILKLVGAGMTNNDIARELMLSIATVKWHLHNVYQKVEVRSRTAAAAYARKINLI